MRTMMTFNLIDQPWIPVVSQDWRQREVSLTELFSTWEGLREIQADNPPTTLAIYRFLLAILHRAYQGPKHVDHWEEIQQDNGKQAIAYLNQWRDRFDLFHPEYPFMQDTALTQSLASEVYALHLMQGDNTSTVFSHEHQWSGYNISLSQAAQLLIRLQTVDISSPRQNYPAPNVGSKNTKATPTINAANVFLKGSDLKETLLLNLMRYDPRAEVPSVVIGDDFPYWETNYAGKPKVDKGAVPPNGYISYITYPWRRLRVFVTDDKAYHLSITKGNELPESINHSQWECNIAFRDGKPVRLSLDKQLWRNSHSFLQTAENSCRPRIIDWLAELRVEDLIGDLIHLQVFGMCADKAKPESWSIEQFSVPTCYVLDQELSKTLKIAIDVAENHKQVFSWSEYSPYGQLSKSLKKNKDSLPSLDGASRYWATLDHAFLELLQALPVDKTIDGNGITYGHTQLPEWTKTVQKAARDAFTESIAAIRNYEARAKALRALEWKLADLRASPEEKEAKKAKSKKKKTESR
jgi:CRISPR system Cascade subunit CasA